VIEVAAKAAKAACWELRNSPKPASKGDLATGRGIAAMQYEGTRRLRRHRLRGRGEQEDRQGAGHPRRRRARRRDHHQPRGPQAQIEGNVVHGISRSLKEEVVLDGKTSKSRDWESYLELPFTELPKNRAAPRRRSRRPAPTRRRS
jgi:CO/xanthine dehydrogenase Mo-binding subunit